MKGPVRTVEGGPITLINRSGTTTGADQTVAAANPERRYLLVQNVSDTAMTIDFDTAAVAGTGILLAASGGIQVWDNNAIPVGALHLVCASGSKAFVCKEG